MDLQLLQNRLEEVQNHLSDFKRRLAMSEDRYQQSIKLLTNSTLKSALMEQYIILNKRQKDAISRMESVKVNLQDQLKRFSNPNT